MKAYHTLAAIQQDLGAGQMTCAQLVKHYLGVIDQKQHLNVFVEVFAAEASSRATEIDAKLKAGTAGPLAGLVFAIKDNIVYEGHSSTAGSHILAGFKSLFTATALQRLLDADAIVIGRTNCDEFAMGSSNENSYYGPVKNPLDETRVPGGSSGGSAAAVAAGMCHAALGSDTGGSIRQPAAFCGLLGLKPTYGRISRYGLIAYGSSFDQIGPFAHSVEDIARITEIMAGADPHDSTSSSSPVGSLLPAAPKLYKLAVFADALHSPGMDAKVVAKLKATIAALQVQGHTVDVVDFPYLPYVVPTYYIVSTAEASSNLSRYDGIRFGYSSPSANGLEEVYVKSRSEGFGPEVQRRIMLGTFVLSSGYYDAYFTKAQQVRRLIQDYTRQLLGQYDFILTPTTPTPAFKIGEKADDPIQMYLADIFTVHANLSGCPAISVPTSLHSNGMPIGMQLLADYFQEQKLMSGAQLLMGLDSIN